LSQVVRVERVRGDGGSGFGFEEDGH